MKARDVMTPNPITVTPQATLAEVWDLMREMDIRHVPVTRGGILIGMLSDRDLGSLDVGRVLTTEGADALRRTLGTPVVAAMSSDVISAGPETDLAEVIDLMIENKVGAIPVISPGTREVVGIASYVDVLQAVQNLVAEE
ncbi:MAG TPA: CBS domain-containing protein [Methylomirabilota bacterium]|jgi:acetoin utilization protein AcuB|nr:CBS domain-containing protein [Methylomirabilota bacterium]